MLLLMFLAIGFYFLFFSLSLFFFSKTSGKDSFVKYPGMDIHIDKCFPFRVVWRNSWFIDRDTVY